MFRRFTKKRIAVVVSAIAALALAAGAYAYFTSTGSTTGTGSVGTATNWTVKDNTVTSTLYPGQGSFSFAGVITNAGSGQQGLNSLTVTINAPTGGGTNASEQPCGIGDFVLSATSGSGWTVAGNGESATYTWSTPVDLAPSGTQSYPAGLSIAMRDLSRPQDNCQSATINWGDSVS